MSWPLGYDIPLRIGRAPLSKGVKGAEPNRFGTAGRGSSESVPMLKMAKTIFFNEQNELSQISLSNKMGY